MWVTILQLTLKSMITYRKETWVSIHSMVPWYLFLVCIYLTLVALAHSSMNVLCHPKSTQNSGNLRLWLRHKVPYLFIRKVLWRKKHFFPQILQNEKNTWSTPTYLYECYVTIWFYCGSRYPEVRLYTGPCAPLHNVGWAVYTHDQARSIKFYIGRNYSLFMRTYLLGTVHHQYNHDQGGKIWIHFTGGCCCTMHTSIIS